MVRDELVPYLSRRFGTRLPGASLTLRFVGLGQSQIDQTLKDHVPLPADVMTSSQFEGGRVDFTFSLPRDTPEDRATTQGAAETRSSSTWATPSMPRTKRRRWKTHVMKLLEARGQTLTLAEVGSGGALAAALNGAEGTHQVLVGAVRRPDRGETASNARLHEQPDEARQPADAERLAASGRRRGRKSVGHRGR